mmetsp:Transcript_13752/g.21961  ORF Transcript_13752/g.21961 Transcript_13752/m.21961 type:complete len:275 (-) Transcript_13752:90-914(-)
MTIVDMGTRNSFMEFSNALEGTKCPLRSLELSKLGNGGLKILCSALISTKAPIQVLDLSVSMIGDVAVDQLCQALQLSPCPVRQLILAGNLITDKGAKYIADTLIHPGHKTIKSIDVSENELSDIGAEHLASALSSPSCSLQKFDIAHNSTVTSCGYKAILAALLTRKEPSLLINLRGLNLTEQDFTHCGITPHIFKNFATDEKRHCQRLLKWVSDIVRRSQAMQPQIESILQVKRIQVLVIDYLFWRHPYTFNRKLDRRRQDETLGKRATAID